MTQFVVSFKFAAIRVCSIVIYLVICLLYCVFAIVKFIKNVFPFTMKLIDKLTPLRIEMDCLSTVNNPLVYEGKERDMECFI